MDDTESFASADREKRVLITQAEMQAEEALVKDIKAAEAEKKSAELHAEQEKIQASAAAEGSKEAAEMKAEEIMIAADSEEKALPSWPPRRRAKHPGLVRWKPRPAWPKASTFRESGSQGKDGTAEANVMEIKFQAEAK